MGASNETDKTREQTAKEPENASHLPDKLVAQRREVAEKARHGRTGKRVEAALGSGGSADEPRHRAEPPGAVVQGCGPVARKVALKRWTRRGIA